MKPTDNRSLTGKRGRSPVVTWTLLAEHMTLCAHRARVGGYSGEKGALPTAAREILSAAMRDRRLMARLGLRDLCERTIKGDKR